MHILSASYHSEFLATPQLIRFDSSRRQNGFEPTLLIKGSTLLLKYILQGVRMQLAFAPLRDRLLYALKVYDDENRAGVLWSLLENDREKDTLKSMVHFGTCETFLFNELALNVAYSALPLSVPSELIAMVEVAATGRADHSALKDEADAVISRFHKLGISDSGLIVIDLPGTTLWTPQHNHLITSHATSSLVDIFHKDEGGQQEQIGIWLTDNLNPLGVHHGPQIPKGKRFRELTDILLSDRFGSILIESKALAIFARDSIPSRTKLAGDLGGHITKAIKQLNGGIRRLKDGAPVTSKSGIVLDIERTQPMHGIVLIPDLDLIEDRKAYGLPLMKEFVKSTGGFLHILDIAELLRVVQAAEIIANSGTNTTRLMAFNYYLMERLNIALKEGTLCIEVLLRFATD